MPKKNYKKKSNQKYLKKTSKTGAYAPARKKQMIIRRAPMVECKKDERYEWNGLTHFDGGVTPVAWSNNLLFRDVAIGDVVPEANNLPNQVIVGMPDTYIYRTQGFGHNDMVGDSVFIKYLKCKFEIKLPQDEGLIHFPQCRMYLVHGFVKKSLDANEYTNPTLANLTRANYREFISDQVDKYFTNSDEPMRYQPKGRTNSAIKILGKQEIKWNKNKSILPDPVRQLDNTSLDGHTTLGSLPTKIVDCEWPMMRKVKYEVMPSNTGSFVPANTPTRPSNFIVNHEKEGYPFWAIYMPGGANIIYGTEANRIKFRHNDVCYFTDS